MPIEPIVSMDWREAWIGLQRLEDLDTRELLARLGSAQILHIYEGVTRSKTLLSGMAMPPSIRAMEENGTTLLDKGHMLASMKIKSITLDRVRLGFGAPKEAEKAYKHQFGIGVPPRPFFGIRPGDEDKLLDIADRWAWDEVKRAGLH
jgi:hypothetical protein